MSLFPKTLKEKEPHIFIQCQACGALLDGTVHTDPSRWPDNRTVTVVPCPRCLDQAKQAARQAALQKLKETVNYESVVF